MTCWSAYSTNINRSSPVAHVLAEVSNLTDLSGDELAHARRMLHSTFSLLTEVEMPSAEAALDPVYAELGLTDAAIARIARSLRCIVLRDDLMLYLLLSSSGVDDMNFSHLREGTWV
jgi:hypothetical protein